jgi:hypothetical protein
MPNKAPRRSVPSKWAGKSAPRYDAWDWLALAMKLWKGLTDSSTKSSKTLANLVWHAAISVRSSYALTQPFGHVACGAE